MIVLKFKKLSENAIIPTKKFPSDAGWDVYSIEDIKIPAHDQQLIRTGIQLAGVKCYYDWVDLVGSGEKKNGLVEDSDAHVVIQAWSRSGIDSKKGLHVGAGIIDQGFRGEVLVLLKNMSNQPQEIWSGDKIAQLVPLYLPETNVEEVFEIEVTDRGSTGGIMKHFEETRNERFEEEIAAIAV